jgi:hypothetical protein
LKGHVILLPQGEYWVGRQATNDLQLEDNAVSRRHCLFMRSGEDCTLKDLDSRNGTFVTGTPVTEHQLEPGDEIRIGGSVFCYLVDASAGLPAKQVSISSTRELRCIFPPMNIPSCRLRPAQCMTCGRCCVSAPCCIPFAGCMTLRLRRRRKLFAAT